MSIQKLFGINGLKAVSNPYQNARVENNFVKNTFNFGDANPNRPNSVVTPNALNDPTKGTRLYCLG